MNVSKMKLKIGEFSRLNQVTVKTLRFYEELGLLMPAEIDEYSGYRYYEVSQIQIMNNISYLKKLGFSLDEIKNMFSDECYEPTAEMVDEKLKICQEKIKVLKNCEEELNRLQKILKSKVMEDFQIKPLPAIIVASHRRVIASYQDLFDICPNVIGPEMNRLGCVCSEPGYCYTIDHNNEYRESNIDIEYCEQVLSKKQDSDLVKFKDVPCVKQALCFKHYGPYSSFPLSWEKIYSFIEKNGYQIVDHPRFCYIDGIWNKDNESEWLTEIQVPIKK